MLTILHRQNDGSERLFMAESIEAVQPKGEQCVPVRIGRFRYRGAVDDIPSGEFEIGQPFGAVFVMNDQGATVAKYMAPPAPVNAGKTLDEAA